ncbi:hypothetical protein [Pseudoxanthomonas sp. JBR18]|uniref:hypothetical protein n=1 Tax=Pseudoxanthomonas sp. JBR18 TaxID=2969308 RepID=UPI002305053F|nr:hypothetical protein [Pseudoxanthomonas sp. JBR18]WCE05547.1 hypothetical protein PJ250_06185 [Pseudoxanthomonas sp. JBR18]
MPKNIQALCLTGLCVAALSCLGLPALAGAQQAVTDPHLPVKRDGSTRPERMTRDFWALIGIEPSTRMSDAGSVDPLPWALALSGQGAVGLHPVRVASVRDRQRIPVG